MRCRRPPWRGRASSCQRHKSALKSTVLYAIASLTHRRDRLRKSRRGQLGDVWRRRGGFGFDNLDGFLCHRSIEEIVFYVSIPLAVRGAIFDPPYFRVIAVSGQRCALSASRELDRSLSRSCLSRSRPAVVYRLGASRIATLQADHIRVQLFGTWSGRFNEILHAPKLARQKFRRNPARFGEFAGVDPECNDFIAAEIVNAFMRYLGQQIKQADVDLHLLNVAPSLTVELLQPCLLKRHNLPVRITNLPGQSPRNDEFGGVDSKPCTRRHLPHL